MKKIRLKEGNEEEKMKIKKMNEMNINVDGKKKGIKERDV